MIRVDKEQVRGHVDEVVQASVEETLNSLLEAEAGERSVERLDTRAGHYSRKLVGQQR